MALLSSRSTCRHRIATGGFHKSLDAAPLYGFKGRTSENGGLPGDQVNLLGELNADERHLGELGELPVAAAVIGVPTNTRKTKSYDNIIFDGLATTEYTGQFGVLDLMAEFALTKDEALVVSDHMPVWAVFSAVERGGGGVGRAETAGRATEPVRR